MLASHAKLYSTHSLAVAIRTMKHVMPLGLFSFFQRRIQQDNDLMITRVGRPDIYSLAYNPSVIRLLMEKEKGMNQHLEVEASESMSEIVFGKHQKVKSISTHMMPMFGAAVHATIQHVS